MRSAPGFLSIMILWRLISKWGRLPLKMKFGVVSIPIIVTLIIVCGVTGFLEGWSLIVLLLLLVAAISTLPASYDDPLYQ